MRLHHAYRLCAAGVLLGSGCTAGKPRPEPYLRLDTLRVHAPEEAGVRHPCTVAPDSSGSARTLRCLPVQPDTTPPRG